MKNKGSIIIKLLSVLFVGWLLFSIVKHTLNFVEQAEHYRRVWRDPVTVTAEVTHHEEKESSEDTDYESYIRYTVDGKEYKDVKYETSSVRSKLTAVGTQVEVQVSPEDPGQLMFDLERNSFGLVFPMLIAACLAVALSCLVQSGRSKGLEGRPDTETIRRDLKLTVWGSAGWIACLLETVVIALACWRYPMLLGIGWQIVGGVFAALFLLCLVLTILDLGKINREEYTVERATLERKEISSDSDSTTYLLHFRSGDKTWNTSVSSDTYAASNEGDTEVVVILKSKNRPTLHYSAQGVAR